MDEFKMVTARDLERETGYSSTFIRSIFKEMGIEKSSGKMTADREEFYKALDKHNSEKKKNKYASTKTDDIFGWLLNQIIVRKYRTVAEFCRDKGLDIDNFRLIIYGRRKRVTDKEYNAIIEVFDVKKPHTI